MVKNESMISSSVRELKMNMLKAQEALVTLKDFEVL